MGFNFNTASNVMHGFGNAASGMGQVASALSPSSGSGSGQTSGQFINNAVSGSNTGTGQAQQGAEAMMADMRAINDTQMKLQMETAIMNLMVKMNEALCKFIKAMGDAIKGLAG
jgi:hypothetical protein